VTIRLWRANSGSVRACLELCESLGRDMEAVAAIFIFVVVIILLNIVEFGRAD
jgi:hypothetical protein